MLLSALNAGQGMTFGMKSCSISLLVRNDLLREGLGRLLAENGFYISQSVDSMAQLDASLDDENHIIIVDYSSSSKQSINYATRIINSFSESKSVILADTFDFATMKGFFLSGSSGYILKDVPYKTFVSMIKLVSMGQNVVPTHFIEMMSEIDVKSQDASPSSISPQEFDLSDRDVQILDRLSLGLSNKMISRDLGISEATVKVAVKTIYRKLSVNNRTQAAILAREIDLLPRQRVTRASAVNSDCGTYL